MPELDFVVRRCLDCGKIFPVHLVDTAYGEVVPSCWGAHFVTGSIPGSGYWLLGGEHWECDDCYKESHCRWILTDKSEFGQKVDEYEAILAYRELERLRRKKVRDMKDQTYYWPKLKAPYDYLDLIGRELASLAETLHSERLGSIAGVCKEMGEQLRRQ